MKKIKAFERSGVAGDGGTVMREEDTFVGRKIKFFVKYGVKEKYF